MTQWTAIAKRWGSAVAAATLLAACASYNGRDLTLGQARLDDVRAAMGEPAAGWQRTDGSVRLAYPRGPMGFHTYMVDLDAAGRLAHIENVLDMDHFAAVKPGMSKAQVLELLGPPQPMWTIYFAARDELAWEWRYCDAWNAGARFDVLFDGTQGTVRSTLSIREHCGYGDCACSH